MTFAEIRAQVVELLQHEGRVAYRVLKRQFALDDEYLEDLKADLIDAKRVAVDEDGKVLVWVGSAAQSPVPQTPHPQTPDVRRQTLDPRLAEAERRQLTVMFCDLVGSTPLSQQLDPEELREVILAYQEACAQVIRRFEGYLARYVGDGLLVYFGYPQAHEDDAQRAVRAGLGIAGAIHELPLPHLRLSHPLQVRIGIHTGLVVAGDMGGGGYRDPLAIVGETPNIAARIQGLAEPDTVVISTVTSRLVEGFFACRSLGPQPLKGISAPVEVYQVLAESGIQSRFEMAVRAGLTPLIGREHEVGLLQERWTRAQQGAGQAVLLSGEPGIGKSRLVQTLYFLGELVPAREHLERGIALYDPQQHHAHAFLYGHDPGVACLGYAALVLWYLGYPDQALQRSHEALTLVQRLSHPYSLAYAPVAAARLQQLRREGQATQERAEAIITHSTEQGLVFLLPLGTILRGWALAEQGQAEEGIMQIQQGLAALSAIGAELYTRANFLALLAKAYGKARQVEEGLTVLAEALAVTDKTGERYYEAELYRLKGQLTLQKLAVASGQLSEKSRVGNAYHDGTVAEAATVGGAHPTGEEEAEACFLKAIEIARRQSAKSLELRAAMSLSRLWQRQGKQKEAHEMLAEIYGWFTEGFDTKDLQEAKVLLEALEGRSR